VVVQERGINLPWLQCIEICNKWLHVEIPVKEADSYSVEIILFTYGFLSFCRIFDAVLRPEPVTPSQTLGLKF
jgi:hypothetical protein